MGGLGPKKPRQVTAMAFVLTLSSFATSEMWATRGRAMLGFSLVFHILHLIVQRGSKENFRTDPF